ncbi:MAG: hypothetical protein IJH37_05835 [Clostridia bacterium]|nr:hypothetical protein [Clostridia bacterium]
MKKFISTASAIAIALLAVAPATLVAYANTSSNDADYVFTVANNAASNQFRYKFVLLDTDENSNSSRFFVIASANYGAGPIHNAGDKDFSWDPTDADTLSGYLNQTWFNIDGSAATTSVLPTGTGSGAAIYTLIPEIKSYIDQNHEWAMPGYDGLTTLAKTTITCPVTVLSRDEHEAYKEIVGYVGDTAANHSNQNWLLRSPQTASLTNGLYISKDSGNRGAATITGTFRFRPCFWLGVDFFKNVKLDLANTGSKVVEAIADNYTRSDLESVGYTEEDLDDIFGASSAIDETVTPSITGTAKPGYTLTASHAAPSAGLTAVYQWQQADSANGEYSDITGATGSTYTLKNAQANKYVRVIAYLTDGVSDGAATASAPVSVAAALTPGAADNTNGGQQALNTTYRLTVADTSSGLGETARTYFLLDDSGSGDAKFLLIEAAAVARLKTNATQGMLYTDTNTNNRFDPEVEGNLAYWLKNTYAQAGDISASGPVNSILNSNKLAPGFIPYLDTDHEWLTEGGCTAGPCTDDYVVKSPAAILSKTELMQYRDRFGWAEGLSWTSGTADFEMLRTPRQNSVSVRLLWRTNDNSGSAVGGGIVANAATGNTGAMIRPVFWLSEDVFENVKIDVATMGDGVKSMLSSTYSRSDLSALYSSTELDKIYGTESVIGRSVVSGMNDDGATYRVGITFDSLNPSDYENIVFQAGTGEDAVQKGGTVAEVLGGSYDGDAIVAIILDHSPSRTVAVKFTNETVSFE